MNLLIPHFGYGTRYGGFDTVTVPNPPLSDLLYLHNDILQEIVDNPLKWNSLYFTMYFLGLGSGNEWKERYKIFYIYIYKKKETRIQIKIWTIEGHHHKKAYNMKHQNFLQLRASQNE